MDIDWIWSNFFSNNFCSVLNKWFIDLRKVKTDHFKFRTDLWEQVWDDCPATQEMIILSSWFLKEVFETKLKLVHSLQVWIWLESIAFHLQQFWLQTLVAINLGSCQRSFRIMPEIIPSFFALQSEVAVLFDLNLSRSLDLLLCTELNSELVDLFWLILLRVQWMIEIEPSKEWCLNL